MRRFLLFTILLCLCFFCALGVIRARQYDDADLRAFLYDGCADAIPTHAPCWQGIRPGVMRFDEAVALLEAHLWIGDLTINESLSASYVSWTWSGAQPAFLNNEVGHEPPSLWATNSHVSFITLPTTMTYGELERLIGAPDDGVFQVFRTQDRPLTQTGGQVTGEESNTRHFAAYDDTQMVIETRLTCPAPALLFWDAPVTFTIFSSGLMRDVPFGTYDLSAWLYDSPCP
jgi:hypothetical protein